MTIICRYLVRTYLGIISTCLAAFVAIYLVIDFLERIGKFSRAGAPLSSSLAYFICKIPEIVTQTAPMAVLMGTILAIGMLARNSEITAMKSSGISLVQIGRPLLATAALISLVLLIVKELLVPVANEKLRYIDQVVIQKKGIGVFFRQNNIWFRDNEYVLQARLFDPAKQTLEGITIWKLGQGLTPISRIEAVRATPVNGELQLEGARIRNFSDQGIMNETPAGKLPVKIDIKPTDLKVVAKSAEDMGFISLWKYCESLREGGYDTTSYRTLMHSKLSLPFTALVMAFLGIPFALRDSRSKGMGAGIGISLAIGLTYFMTNAILLSLGQAGALPAPIAAWAANFIFAATGLWFTLTVDS